MIDLHLHLDGSLSIEDFKYLAKTQQISLGDDFPESIYVSKNCKSLLEYLQKFDLPLKFLQTEESLEYVTCSLVKRLYALGYIYCEIRYAPLLHLQKGLTMEQVIEATIRGLKKGLEGTENFDANLILCAMRHADEELNLKTIELANKYKNDKVCGVDLAGGESIHPAPYFKRVFGRARELGLNITIHAGESTTSQEIMDAIDLGAMRIGHGVHLSLDEASVKKAKDNNVMFEFCPTSNLQTKSLLKYEDIPVLGFLKNNLDFCINSDNMTVSNVTGIEDMRNMIKTFNLSKSQVFNLYETAIKHAFVDECKRDEIVGLLKVKFDKFFEDNYCA